MFLAIASVFAAGASAQKPQRDIEHSPAREVLWLISSGRASVEKLAPEIGRCVSNGWMRESCGHLERILVLYAEEGEKQRGSVLEALRRVAAAPRRPHWEDDVARLEAKLAPGELVAKAAGVDVLNEEPSFVKEAHGLGPPSSAEPLKTIDFERLETYIYRLLPSDPKERIEAALKELDQHNQTCATFLGGRTRDVCANLKPKEAWGEDELEYALAYVLFEPLERSEGGLRVVDLYLGQDRGLLDRVTTRLQSSSDWLVGGGSRLLQEWLRERPKTKWQAWLQVEARLGPTS